MNRRRFLVGAAGLAGLSGCSSTFTGADEPETDSETATRTSTGDRTSTEAATPTATRERTPTSRETATETAEPTATATATPSPTPTPTPTSAASGVPASSLVVERGGTPDRTLTVDVLLVDAEGRPLPGEPVELGGQAAGRSARTDGAGRVTFVESVGPPPCNSHRLVLPDRDRVMDLGCENGGVTHPVRVEVDADAADATPDGSETTGIPGSSVVVDRGSSPETTVTIDALVRSEGGEGVADERVTVYGTGSSEWTARTDVNGRVTAVDTVGDAGCDALRLELPERDVSRELDCPGGASTVGATLTF